MRTSWYIVELNAVPWKVGPISVARGKGGKGMYPVVGRDQELFNFQQAVKAELLQQGAAMCSGKIQLTIVFWRRIEQYKTEKSRNARSHEADATNLLKATEDACQGILFDNDRDNVDVRSVIVEQGFGVDDPKLLIRVQEVGSEVLSLDFLEEMPDEIYGRLYGSPAYQLSLGINKPNTQLQKEDDKYAQAPEIF